MNRSMQILLSVFTFLIPILIYAPSFHGTSLWDDQYFIFDRYYSHGYSYYFFWRNALWPLFESTTLTLYNLFGTETFYWHLVNFILHILNGILLGKVIKHFKPSLAIPLTVIFWVHPLCALTVGWIVQLKTLMSFFFSLLAFYLLISRKVTKKTLLLSLLFFFLSVTSKSATVMLPFMAFFFLILKKSWRHHVLTVLPFVLISLLSLARMSFHDDLQLTIKNSEATISTLIETPVESPVEVVTEQPTETPMIEPQAEPETPEVSLSTEVQPVPPETESIATVETTAPDPMAIDEAELTQQIEAYNAPTKLKIIAYTSSYYLSAPWLPIDLSPIHSNYRGGYTTKNYFGFMLVALCLGAMFWRKFTPIIFLMSQLIILTPFLGFIAAPFMTFSIVSEQHLYLALPFAILAQLILIQKIFKRHSSKVFFVFFILLSGLTASYSPTFKNEENFYQRVLEVYPYDRLSALNLANHYFKSGRIRQAVFVLNKALQQAEDMPYLKEDVMHPYILKSYEQMSLLQ